MEISEQFSGLDMKNLIGATDVREMEVNVPTLSMVPVPGLQVDQKEIAFDMEVKEGRQNGVCEEW